jgi:hypothetical protein
LFIEEGCDVKVRLVAKMHIVGARLALQPLRKLLLRTSLAKIAKDRPFLFIPMFILKGRGRLLASGADPIPQVFISGIAFETPDDDPGWYSSHEELLLRGKTTFSPPSNFLRDSCSVSGVTIACTYCNTGRCDVAPLE